MPQIIKFVLGVLLVWSQTGIQAEAKTLVDKKIIPHFTSGYYLLVSGNPDQCGGDDRFFFKSEENRIYFGVHHRFMAINASTKLISTVYGEENCQYETIESIKSSDRLTHLNFESTLMCGKVARYTLYRQAEIDKKVITLKILQTGQDPFNYTCKWSLMESGMQFLLDWGK